MLTTSILLHPFESSVLRTVIHRRTLPSIRSVQICRDQTIVDPAYIYIGTPETVCSLLNSVISVEDITFLVSGDSEQLSSTPCPSSCNIITTSLDLISLLNYATYSLDEYRTWNEKLNLHCEISSDLNGLLKIAFEFIQVPLVLINNYYKALATYIPDDRHDYILDEFRKNNFLCFDSIQSLHRDILFEKLYSPYHREAILENGERYIISRIIQYNKSPIARLSLHLPDDKPNRCLSDLSADLAYYITRVLSRNAAYTHTYSDDMDHLVSDLIDQRIDSDAEIEQRLSLIPDLKLYKRYQLVLFQFYGKKRQNIPWIFIKNQLLSLFPECSIAQYQGQLVLLAKKTEPKLPLGFDQEKLSALLALYDGYALIGNFSKFLTSMHALYFQANAALPLAIDLRTDPEQRIFYYEDYSIYHIISMCIAHYEQNAQKKQLIYLCHPSLIALFRYDKKNHTNLMQVLQTYLSNDRNTTQTAKILFIHRNTLLYKLGKIEEITGESLENQILRERLMFSFHLIEYMIKVLHINPLF